MDDLLQQGVIAYKGGNRDEARKIFITVVKQNPEDERAWGWMYQVSNDDKERIYCLKQVLRINPKSEKANQLLGQLIAPPLTPISPAPMQVTLPIVSTKKCPHCAELIQTEAKICKHCGRNVSEKIIPTKKAKKKKTSSRTNQSMILACSSVTSSPCRTRIYPVTE